MSNLPVLVSNVKQVVSYIYLQDVRGSFAFERLV